MKPNNTNLNNTNQLLNTSKLFNLSFTILLLLFSNILFAQDTITSEQSGLLQRTNYCMPFLSEVHSSINKMEIGYNKSYSEFDLLSEKSKFERPMVELHVGFEMPLFASGYGVPKSSSKWGLGVRLPLSVHVLEDMWGPETAPVINTDYRFGGPRLVAIRHISDTGLFKNISFSWLTIFHECTHLGDEIVIYRKDEKFPITRINVSYEFTEFQLTLNDPIRNDETYHSLKLGLLYRISNRGAGWFSVRTDVEATQDVNIRASEHRAEYYGQYQLQRTDGFLATKQFVNILSFEVRNRLRYGYPLFDKINDKWEAKDIKEKMDVSFNFYLGYKFYPNEGTQSVGLFLHAYKGLNPYGQLRNYPSYPFFGLSITYEP